jgi:hypothetical protein
MIGAHVKVFRHAVVARECCVSLPKHNVGWTIHPRGLAMAIDAP